MKIIYRNVWQPLFGYLRFFYPEERFFWYTIFYGIYKEANEMCNWTEHMNGDKKHLSDHQEALKLHKNQSFQNGKELI